MAAGGPLLGKPQPPSRPSEEDADSMDHPPPFARAALATTNEGPTHASGIPTEMARLFSSGCAIPPSASSTTGYPATPNALRDSAVTSVLASRLDQPPPVRESDGVDAKGRKIPTSTITILEPSNNLRLFVPNRVLQTGIRGSRTPSQLENLVGTLSESQQGPSSPWHSALARSQRPLTDLIRLLPTELREQLLDYALAATMATKRCLNWNESSQDYVLSDTPETSSSSALPATLATRHLPGTLRLCLADLSNGTTDGSRPQNIRKQHGAFRFEGIDESGSLTHRLTHDSMMRKDCIVPLDDTYEPPLALQVDRKSRALWAKIHHEETVFWIGEGSLGMYEQWVASLSEKV